jgi:hypothetical protein
MNSQRPRAVAFLAACGAAAVFAACSSSSGGLPAGGDDNDSGSMDDGAAPPKDSGAAPHDSGTKADANAACGVQVNSGVAFTDAGGIYCAANMPCDLTQNTCCVSAIGQGTCTSGHSGCGAGNLAAAFECVEDTDCPANQVCCGYASMAQGMAGSKCQDISASPDHKCSPAPSSTQGSVQFCQKTCECKDGSECIPQSCQVNGAPIAANLTMCGLQGAPYNCAPR